MDLLRRIFCQRRRSLQFSGELALNHGGELAEEGDFSEEVAKEISVVKGNRISLEYYYSSCCPDEVSVRSTGNMSKPVRRDGNWILMT